MLKFMSKSLYLNAICMMQVSSAFSQMLNLHNLSEDISNAQSERAARMGEVSFSCKFC